MRAHLTTVMIEKNNFLTLLSADEICNEIRVGGKALPLPVMENITSFIAKRDPEKNALARVYCPHVLRVPDELISVWYQFSPGWYNRDAVGLLNDCPDEEGLQMYTISVVRPCRPQETHFERIAISKTVSHDQRAREGRE